MIDFIIQFCRSREQLYRKPYKQEGEGDPSEDFFKGKASAFSEMTRFLDSLNDFLERIKEREYEY